MQCEKCGRPNPQMAEGRSSHRSLNARALAYEGYSPGGKVFTYKRHALCMACRHGTPSQLRNRPAVGEALKQELIRINARGGE